MFRDNLWSEVLLQIEPKISKQHFDTWFLPTFQLGFSDGTLQVGVPNVFYADWLTNQYLGMITDSIRGIAHDEIEIKFIIAEGEKQSPPVSEKKVSTRPLWGAKSKGASTTYQPPYFDPKYTFGKFVVGTGNQVAYAASRAAAEQPGHIYNPLFIYGGVGLGKTHLLQAIGHFILSRMPQVRICYICSEEFMNELVNAIRYNKTSPFRNKYRNMDVVLIDDVQFIAGKERTQEELFHTYNALYGAHKQIVFSSDRPPRDITTIEERLRSRFEWGLVADIQQPDLETKIAILKKKVEHLNVSISEEVFLFMASNFASNIRQLEGCLNRIIAYSAIKKMDINLDLVRNVLQDILIEKERAINIERIQQVVSDFFNLKVSDIKSKSRTADIALPRQIAMYLARAMTNISLPKVGESFGGRDHTTVLHAERKIKKLIEKDAALKNKIQHLRNLIQNVF